ncbi:MAG: hypothetical protein IT288_05960 [Bdellovibrionales bacterium]|nr:hypothetical protein [Bdellovibrionales bacterium]
MGRISFLIAILPFVSLGITIEANAQKRKMFSWEAGVEVKVGDEISKDFEFWSGVCLEKYQKSPDNCDLRVVQFKCAKDKASSSRLNNVIIYSSQDELNSLKITSIELDKFGSGKVKFSMIHYDDTLNCNVSVDLVGNVYDISCAGTSSAHDKIVSYRIFQKTKALNDICPNLNIHGTKN